MVYKGRGSPHHAVDVPFSPRGRLDVAFLPNEAQQGFNFAFQHVRGRETAELRRHTTLV